MDADKMNGSLIGDDADAGEKLQVEININGDRRCSLKVYVDFCDSFDNVENPSCDVVPCDGVLLGPGVVERAVSIAEDVIYAADGDDAVYGYSQESDVPDGQMIIETKEAIHRLVKEWAKKVVLVTA